MTKWIPPTDPKAVKELFDEYVFTFIEGDIKREIWLAKKAEHDRIAGVYPGTYPGGGNLLAALGLVCYTEFLGSFHKPRGEPGERFDAFFGSMGPPYQQFLKAQTKPEGVRPLPQRTGARIRREAQLRYVHARA